MEGYEVKVLDSIEVGGYSFKDILDPYLSSKHIVSYDAEYGTTVIINMGREMVLVKIPPDYKEEVVYVQTIREREE